MFHVKFQDNQTSGSGKEFTIYRRGSHLGHIAWIVYINFSCPFQWTKVCFDWPSAFGGDDL